MMMSTVAFPRQIAATKRALLTSVDRAYAGCPASTCPPRATPSRATPLRCSSSPSSRATGRISSRCPPETSDTEPRCVSILFRFFLVGTCRDRAIKRFRTPRAPARGARAAGTVAPTAAEAAKVSRTTQSIDGSTTAAVRASLGAETSACMSVGLGAFYTKVFHPSPGFNT